MDESWKNIDGWPGKYMISTSGQIRSYINTGPRGKILKPYPCKQGYLRVRFGKKTKAVHRLVLETFLGPSDLEVNHINGNKSDNRLENLEYLTRSENMIHAYKNGLHSGYGDAHFNAKISKALAIEIYNAKGGYSEIARRYNLKPSLVRKIKVKETWKHIHDRE